MISIIISTCNRSEILEATLSSINSSIGGDYYGVEIIVINNNIGLLEKKVQSIVELIPSIQHIVEHQAGLSYARNKGIKQALAPWLIFLDDDVKIDKTFLSKAKEIIQSDQFDCFGGMYYPWYPEEEKPKWLANDFGEKKLLRTDTGLIYFPKDGFLSAGILAIKKEALINVGGFRTDLGMTKSIGYGEEDELQLRLQAAGYRIGFVPDWYIQHAVLPHKHKVSWHLKSTFAHGRDAQRIHQTSNRSQILKKLAQVIIMVFIKRGPVALFKWFFQKEYYWQNAVLSILKPVYGWAGKWKGLASIPNKPSQ